MLTRKTPQRPIVRRVDLREQYEVAELVAELQAATVAAALIGDDSGAVLIKGDFRRPVRQLTVTASPVCGPRVTRSTGIQNRGSGAHLLGSDGD